MSMSIAVSLPIFSNKKKIYIHSISKKLHKLFVSELHQMSKWLGHRLPSRQSSCPEATAIHILDIPGRVFVIRQDGASAHRARDTVALWSERYSTSFLQHCGRRIHQILTQSTIHSICSVLQKKVYPSRIANVGGWIKKRLIDELERFDQSIVNSAIAEWQRCRLNARVHMSGAHFEHQFQQVYNSAILSSTYQGLLSWWKVDEVLTQ